MPVFSFQKSRCGRLAPCGSQGRGATSGRHLAPVDLKERGGKTGPDVHKAGARCSNKGFLPMSTADYLQLLDWTARQVRSDKQGATPKQFAQLFERLGCDRQSASGIQITVG